MKGLFAVLVLSLAVPAPPARAAAPPVERPAAEAPGWFTRDFAERVVEAGVQGVPLPEGAEVRTSSLAFLGIRPGQQIVISEGTSIDPFAGFGLCTANFLFTDGTRRYIGTAGHCGRPGDKVFMIFAPAGVAYIGDITKSWYQQDQLAPDFALIAIKPEFNAMTSPSMSHWGGPTGVYTGNGIVPVLHSGHGVVIGSGGTPRAGLAYRWGDEWRFEGAIINGDSGSGATVAGGLAAGNITHLALNTGQLPPVWMGGTSMVKILSLVSPLKLMTCPSAVPWPLPGCPPL